MTTDSILFHLGEGTPHQSIPGSPPIYQTSNFIYETVDDMSKALEREHEEPFYTRGTNPTVQILQQKLAALENTSNALVFGSGSAAICTAVISQVKAGDHIVCVDNPYGWTKKLIVDILERFNVSCTFVSADNTAGIIQACNENTSLIYLESPNSWTYEMQDLVVITAFAKQNNITTIIDNSCASPLYQKPADHGIDIIVHSGTKYLAGHSDIVAGVLCTNHETYLSIFKSEYMSLGGIISPNDAWLMIRSLRTLELRMEKISQNAQPVAEYLSSHKHVERLYYTHSPYFAQRELVDKYLSSNGGLMTIDLKTNDVNQVKAICNALNCFKLGCSWGAFESLAFPALTTISSLNYDKPNTPINRIRLSIGLENAETLIADLDNAFKTLD
ncbi:MAG: aminotransferase class I/II-fold pyridoxal phosphate-dependent enzyme [Cyclobacteriaceae bacterium]